MEPILKNEIRLDLICKIIKTNWRKYAIVTFSTALVTSLLVLCIPRYYGAKVMLAPEYTTGMGGGGAMGAVSSMLNLNLGSMTSQDAIAPQFYPDLIKSTDFLVPLMDVQVETEDGEFKGRYVDYIMTQVSYPWWSVLKSKIISIFKEPETFNSSSDYKVNPFRLTKPEYDIVHFISGSIDCVVDTKTDVITITTVAQDPLVVAMVADAVKENLQNFIIKYRTNKAQVDLKYSSELCDEAYNDYIAKQKAYAEFVDNHINLYRQIYKIEEEKLATEVQLAYTTYTTLYQQKMLAVAKLQERTPAFTTLQNANVPLKPAGPKRMFIVLAMTILSFLALTVYYIVKNSIENSKKEVR